MQAGGYGALAGGVIGGIAGGIQALRADAKFWTGKFDDSNMNLLASANDGSSTELKYHSKDTYVWDDGNMKRQEQFYKIKAGSQVKVKLTNKNSLPFGSTLELEDQSRYLFKDTWLTKAFKNVKGRKFFTGQSYKNMVHRHNAYFVLCIAIIFRLK